MTLKELIEKLEAFPPDDAARFYCPTNKQYYYYVYSEIVVEYGEYKPMIAVSYNKMFNKISYEGVIGALRYILKLELKYNTNFIIMDPHNNIKFETK